jgi:HK97 family phage prohead protease
MPVEQCSNGKYRIGDGECVYNTERAANRAYQAYLAIEASEGDDDDDDDDDDMKSIVNAIMHKEETYNDYPEAATNNAKRALKYKEENGSSCGTPVGWTRANQLANRERISRDTIARMASFKRHQQNKDVPYSEGCGGIMWDAWGGDAGVDWAIRKLQQIDEKKQDMIYGYKRMTQDVKDVDAKKGIVTGYFSAFNIKDSDGDIIVPGAFQKSLNEWFPKGRIKHLLNHDPRQPLGKIMELKEDSYGLYYESQIGTHNLGRDFIKMVESDLVKEHSIGFNVKGSRKGKDATELYDVVLYEGSSLTSWGANEYTPMLGLKSMSGKIERIKKLEKFIKHTDATDETIELLMLEIKQLYQLLENFEDLSSQPAAAEAPVEPKVEPDEIAQKAANALDILLLKHF